MDWKSVYRDHFVKLEWKDQQDKKRYLRAYKGAEVRLDDVPLMFVGVGGTGIDAVLTMKDKIETLYDPQQAGRIEYLLIDTDKIGSGRSIDPADTIVIQSSDTAMLLREAQRSNGSRHFISDEIRDWLDNSLSPFRVMNGAAGIRQAGRLILFLNFQRIYDALQRKLRKISEHYDASKCRPKIYLFAGIGGGTGSGMFIDLSYMMRSIQNVDLQGIIFMPDVSCLKPNLREMHKRNIQRNGFAALKELDYLMILDRVGEAFRQDYPGGVIVDTQDPVFDLCMLVGAQKDGREPVGSEQEIFEKTAEYILFEIQEKIFEFGMLSYKSNLANYLPKEPFCERYVAIGAAAAYLPIDYYYGWWLEDVFKAFGLGSGMDTGNNYGAALRGEIEQDVRNEIKNVPYKKWNYYKNAQDHMRQNMEGKLANGKLIPAHFYLLQNEYYKGATEKIREIIRKTKLAGIKREKVAQKLLLRKHTLRNRYEEAYKGCFGQWITANQTQLEESYKILEKIVERMGEYSAAKLTTLPGTFLFGAEEFRQIQQEDRYKQKIIEAAKKLAEDLCKNPARWSGLVGGSPKWLSDYVGKLLWEAFAGSGCLDLERLLKYAAINGYNGQEDFLDKCLFKLDARQLWPRSSYCPPRDDYHWVLAGPELNPVKTWIEDWIKANGDGDVFCANPVTWRLARAILVPGNALFTYDGISKMEMSYISASNRAGLHLYVCKDKDWNQLPSPYFETKWVSGDEAKRGVEQGRNENYRNIFDKALTLGIIRDGKDGYYYIVYDNMEVKIGDIVDDTGDKEIAKNMFIHMFEHRQWVEREVKKKEST